MDTQACRVSKSLDRQSKILVVMDHSFGFVTFWLTTTNRLLFIPVVPHYLYYCTVYVLACAHSMTYAFLILLTACREVQVLLYGKPSAFSLYVKPHMQLLSQEVNTHKGKVSGKGTLDDDMIKAVLQKPIARLEKVISSVLCHVGGVISAVGTHAVTFG